MIRRGLIGSLPFLAISVAASLWARGKVPSDARVPAHWNIRGEVDRYAAFGELVWLIPAIIAGLIALMAILPLIDPRKDNLRRSAGLYLAGWIGGVAVAAAAHLMILYSAVTGAQPDLRYVLAATGGLLVIVGNFLAKSRSNWFAGLRTPWTLTSEHAWTVANRLAGWGFVVTGLFTIAAAFLMGPPAAVAMMLAGLLITLVVAVAASYFAWRSDPERAR